MKEWECVYANVSALCSANCQAVHGHGGHAGVRKLLFKWTASARDMEALPSFDAAVSVTVLVVIESQSVEASILMWGIGGSAKQQRAV